MDASLSPEMRETLEAVIADPSAPSKAYARRLSISKRAVDWRLNVLYRIYGIDGRHVGKKARLLDAIGVEWIPPQERTEHARPRLRESAA